MTKRKLNVLLLGIFLMVGAVTSRAQSQLVIGDSTSEFTFVGTGSSAINWTISTNLCSGGSCTLAEGSASGSGALESSGTYTITTPSQSPMTLQANGNGTFAVTMNGSIFFAYTSSQGTLNGNINISTVSQGPCADPFDCSATALGTVNVTGGSFASAFTSNQGIATFPLALGGNLNTLVGAPGSITGQFFTGGTIVSTTCDFLTGGGWIPNPSGGGNGKGTFAVAGGIKHCAWWGHLNYIDRATGMHVHGTAVTFYGPDSRCAMTYFGNSDPNANNSNTRRIEGNAEVNGQPSYTYRVCATDNGEPGTSDTFFIQVSNGYSAGDTLGGGTQGGGNIQLHKGNPSFCCSTGQ